MKMKFGYAIGIVCAAGLLALASCSSAPKVNRVDSGEVIDISGNWNDSDVRMVTDTLIKQALESPNLIDYIDQYTRSHSGVKPAVTIGTIRNTSSEEIDTSLIGRMFRTSIMNSGQLDFVASGAARSEVRAERDDQNTGMTSDSTAAKLGDETGAQLMLQGEVTTVVDSAGKEAVKGYFVSVNLVNITTNRILWEGENNEVKKTIKYRSNKF
jgi:uncharacterized protein (TIGR02722 family)